jgi:hypothetical protein
MATTNTPIRLTALDRAKIAQLQKWIGLPSLAAVVRYTVHAVHDGFLAECQKAGIEPDEWLQDQ